MSRGTYPETCIQDIGSVGGFVYEPFESAAGIQSNFKVHLIEALNRLPELKRQIVTSMVEILAEADVITGVPSGGLELGREVAAKAAKPFLKIEKYKQDGRNIFRLAGDAEKLDKGHPAVGIVEDVTSTGRSLLEASRCITAHTLVIKAASGLRRGISAPLGITPEDIEFHNKSFPFRPPWEYYLPFPLEAVVTRRIPLWIQAEKEIVQWLPELKHQKLGDL